ncbi:protein NSP-INTERACTING KINASE 2-like [Hibiscus syriacus]|uniref:Protein NSP-INTERACTING KINASE 2-like n=1 Tax=Hibiscus syriacus TaxID=106335 RepID=A0A6A2X4D3_HIBSY|nr:protein NSP-INTERACTING KINASE 2-like [Hibiscus syriacus]
MQVTVDVPDIRGKTEILKILNEAAILAGRCGKTAISSKEIDDSIDRIVAGMEGTVMTDGKSKSLVAYYEIVVTFGMSEIGPWSHMDSSALSADVIIRMIARNSMSEKIAEDINAAVKRLSDRACEIALNHIRNNREAIDEQGRIQGNPFRIR